MTCARQKPAGSHKGGASLPKSTEYGKQTDNHVSSHNDRACHRACFARASQGCADLPDENTVSPMPRRKTKPDPSFVVRYGQQE
jgi:hypothetical protein